MQTIPEEIERGKKQAAKDIAAGSPRLYWQTRGAWGEFLASLMLDRFSVTVEHISDITWAAKDSCQSGYNSVTVAYIDERFGAGSFQAALDEVEQFRRELYRK